MPVPRDPFANREVAGSPDARPLRSLPHEPGIYQFLDKAGTIIYVGKAKNLRNRVSSYFNKTDHESGKTRRSRKGSARGPIATN